MNLDVVPLTFYATNGPHQDLLGSEPRPTFLKRSPSSCWQLLRQPTQTALTAENAPGSILTQPKTVGVKAPLMSY